MDDQHEQSDEAIAARIQAGDQEQYAILMRRYQEKLVRYAVVLVRDADTAADVVQESFIKAFTHLRSFNVKKKFSSWMYRIVHNEAMNTIKKHHREIPMPEGFDQASDEDVDERISQQEMIARVQGCLDLLPTMFAEPLALYFLEDQSYDMISDILHLPPGTVATRIRRGKGYLKTICQSREVS